MLARSWYWQKSYCNFATKHSWMITCLSFFFIHSFFIIHVKSYKNEIWTLQNSKSQYSHQVMALNVSEKLILAKMTLSLCYRKLMNDSLPIILFHLFFFHKSFIIINNEIWTLENSKSQYSHQVMALNVSDKLMLAKMTLSLCYQKLINDSLPIILFHLFFFHKSC